MKDEIWECRDGRKIPVSEMDEQHVRNALCMLIRSRNRRKALQADLYLLAGALTAEAEDDAKWGRS